MSSRVIERVRDVVSVRSLLRAGASRHDIASAVGRGILVRVRRGWVAARDADPMLVAAAQSGVVLTCVTQAKRLGCWVIDDGVVHVAAPPHAGHVVVDGHVHWEKPAIPRRPDSLVDPIENVLAIVARCQPRDAALAIWNSALHEGLVDIDILRRLSLSPAAQALLDEAELRAGRVLFNGWPTGVEVGHAMVHGGPFPATSNSQSTSVGSLAIERFQRPVSYQNVPAALLPDELQDANPLGLWRLRDGAVTRAGEDA